MTFKIELKIKDQRIQDLFDCAFYSPYSWLKSVDVKSVKNGAIPWLKGRKVYLITDREDNKTYSIGEDEIDRALKIFAEKHPYQFGLWMNESEDAITGNLFVQLCCFGEEVYC